MLASVTRQHLLQKIAYLLAENRILRSKLPDRISLNNQERLKLVRAGKKLGPRIKELISIVSYSTFRKWVRSIEDSTPKRPKSKTGKPGRPRIEESLSDVIIRIRTETGWGYTKIIQALRRLGHQVSRQTVRNVLVAAGLGPQPHDHPDTWSEFLRRHAETLWQCDFACKRKWTITGLIDVYFLVFIHLGSRRIWISPSTDNPTGDWTSQQARNFQMHIDDNDLKCNYRCRDNDTKYVKDFDAIFTSSNCKIKRIVPRSPNLQAHVERVIQTIKHEVLNGFCIVSNRHMDLILRTAMDWYNKRRGHSARDNLPPVRDNDPPLLAAFPGGEIVCDSELGGHLKSYRPVA